MNWLFELTLMIAQLFSLIGSSYWDIITYATFLPINVGFF